MLDGILINPDNRFLALSTQDFGLYGGQGPAELHVGRAGETLPFVAAAVPEMTEQRVELVDATPAVQLTRDGGALVNEGPITLSSGPVFTPPSLTPVALAPVVAPDMGLAPSAAGSSAFVPFIIAASVASPAAAEAAPVADTITTSMPPVANPFVGEPVAEAGDTVVETVNGVAETLDTLVSSPLEAATSGPMVAAIVSAVDDSLADLAGSDPLAGVTTLVSLVSVEDVFDVSETATDTLVSTAVHDLLDTLADDLPLAPTDSPLLGESDQHDDSPLGDLHDPLGLI